MICHKIWSISKLYWLSHMIVVVWRKHAVVSVMVMMIGIGVGKAISFVLLLSSSTFTFPCKYDIKPGMGMGKPQINFENIPSKKCVLLSLICCLISWDVICSKIPAKLLRKVTSKQTDTTHRAKQNSIHHNQNQKLTPPTHPQPLAIEQNKSSQRTVSC